MHLVFLISVEGAIVDANRSPTLTATRLSLTMEEKCLRRDSTTGGRGSWGATPPSFNHG